MNKPAVLKCSAVALIAAASMEVFAAKPRVVVVNEDNDHYFKQPASMMNEESLKKYIDSLVGGKVTHFFMCPSGQRPSYGSKVWEPIWTGLDEPGGLNQGEYTTWAKHAKILFEKGIDPYHVWIKQCRERGISPWLSPRMNDAHNADQHLAGKSDRPNEFKVRLGANPSGEVSVVLGTVESGEFNPEVTLNAVASPGEG